jgi:hypothetical protein
MAAQLVDPGLERDPGARGGLVEHERDASSLEGPGRESVGLQLERALHERPQFRGRKLLAGQEVGGH